MRTLLAFFLLTLISCGNDKEAKNSFTKRVPPLEKQEKKSDLDASANALGALNKNGKIKLVSISNVKILKGKEEVVSLKVSGKRRRLLRRKSLYLVWAQRNGPEIDQRNFYQPLDEYAYFLPSLSMKDRLVVTDKAKEEGKFDIEFDLGFEGAASDVPLKNIEFSLRSYQTEMDEKKIFEKRLNTGKFDIFKNSKILISNKIENISRDKAETWAERNLEMVISISDFRVDGKSQRRKTQASVESSAVLIVSKDSGEEMYFLKEGSSLKETMSSLYSNFETSAYGEILTVGHYANIKDKRWHFVSSTNDDFETPVKVGEQYFLIYGSDDEVSLSGKKVEAIFSYSHQEKEEVVTLEKGEYLDILVDGVVDIQRVGERELFRKVFRDHYVIDGRAVPFVCHLVQENFLISQQGLTLNTSHLDGLFSFSVGRKSVGILSLIAAGDVEIEKYNERYLLRLRGGGEKLGERFRLKVNKRIIRSGRLGFYDGRSCVSLPESDYGVRPFKDKLRGVELEHNFEVSGHVVITR